MQHIDYFFMGIFIGFILGLIVLVIPENYQWKNDAINRGFARYNEKTGNWEWKE